MNRLKSIILFMVMAGSVACTEIFEEDISEQGVTMLSPGDSALIRSQEVLFWWEPLEHATGYRLQIVKPDFEAVEELVVDSLVEGNKLNVLLETGAYEWRLRGENSAYQTVYQRRSFRVDTVTNLSATELEILSPEQDYHTQESSLTFEWEEVVGADYYVFELVSPVFWDTTLSATGFSRSFGQMNQEYEWRVSAHNGSGKVSTDLYRFKVDTEGPQAPDLLNPSNNALFSTFPVELSWQRDASEQVAVDSVWLYQIENDGQTMQFTLYRKYAEEAATLSLDTLPDGQFQWMVKSVDKAGNVGEVSEIRNFEVKIN